MTLVEFQLLEKMDNFFDLGLGQLAFNEHPINPKLSVGSMKYLPHQGEQRLLKRIGEIENCEVDSVTVTTGASMALSAIIASLPQKSRILCPFPYYPPYISLIKLFGHEVVFYKLNQSTGWLPDEAELEKLIQSNEIKAVIWNFPHNPTGAVVPKNLEVFYFKLFINSNIQIIYDEVYGDFIYGLDQTANSAKSYENTLVRVKSFSKAYGLAGERLGYIIANPILIREFSRRHWIMAMSAPLNSQLIALQLLEDSCLQRISSLREQLRLNRDFVAQQLNLCPGLQYHLPASGIFFWVKNCNYKVNGTFAAFLYSNGISVVNGKVFGVDDGDWFRLSFAVEPELLCEGLNYFQQLVSKL